MHHAHSMVHTMRIEQHELDTVAVIYVYHAVTLFAITPFDKL